MDNELFEETFIPDEAEVPAFARSLLALTPEQVPSGILTLCVDDGLRDCDGSAASRAICQEDWSRCYQALQTGAMPDQGLPSLEEFESRAGEHAARGEVAIALTRLSYHAPGPELLAAMQGGTESDHPGFAGDPARALTESHFLGASAILDRVVDIAALLPAIYYGATVVFRLSSELYASNRFPLPTDVEVDYADSKGFRSVSFDRPISVTYETEGDKQIRVRCRDEDGLHECAFEFRVRHRLCEASNDSWTITGDSYEGKRYVGRLKVPSAVTTFTKPFLYIHGFGGHYPRMSEYLVPNTSWATRMRAEGYEFLELGFELNGGYVQGNATVVIAAIHRILEAIEPGARLVVTGYSMGGLVARYALASMEKQGIDDPRVTAFVSIDAPQGGAYVPPGAQKFAALFAPKSNEAKKMLNVLRTPAAKQMLLYWTASTSSGKRPLVTDERKKLCRELNTLGYPTKVRTIAVSYGRGDGVGEAPKPKQFTLKWHGNWLVGSEIRAIGKSNKSFRYFSGYHPTHGSKLFPFKSKITGGTAYDGAPGSKGDHNAQVAKGARGSKKGKVDHTVETNNYIPTVSALGFASDNPYYAVAEHGHESAFDCVYYSSKNHGHGAAPEPGALDFVVHELEETVAPASWYSSSARAPAS